MPVLFVGHGSPMNMILDNDFTRSLIRWGKALPRPKAIMVISAHWLSKGTRVASGDKPEMIYDFSGFPKELYNFKYACPGASEFARQIQASSADLIECDHVRGLDHAAYAVLKYMFPAADIPVFEVSLDYLFNQWEPKPLRYHYGLAQRFVDLRTQGVLIMASGNMVHNLSQIEYDIETPVYDWALKLDEKMKEKLSHEDHAYLIDILNHEKNAALAIPTLDHYLPMIYALGLQEKGESLKFMYEGIQNGSISMRSFQIG
ncbi:MAG: 4,5-DOPA dioxygenase extradiol [Candidatus Omnitrophica bacterium]|nr:4,5-DOPA dioxygenase extradiol [Candidatus Omnitrophota bacterium]